MRIKLIRMAAMKIHYSCFPEFLWPCMKIIYGDLIYSLCCETIKINFKLQVFMAMKNGCMGFSPFFMGFSYAGKGNVLYNERHWQNYQLLFVSTMVCKTSLVLFLNFLTD